VVREAAAGPTIDRHVVQLPPRDHFAWLQESSSRTSVFIPVLLGAGVLLSGLAWLVERLARATGAASTDLSRSEVLRPLLIPPTPLVGPAGVPTDDQRSALLAPTTHYDDRSGGSSAMP
jgi:hypothetical protein